MPTSREARTASAATRSFFQHLEASPLSPREVSTRSGVHLNSFYHWKAGRFAATVTNMEAALAVLGLELVIRPIEQPANSNQENTHELEA